MFFQDVINHPDVRLDFISTNPTNWIFRHWLHRPARWWLFNDLQQSKNCGEILWHLGSPNPNSADRLLCSVEKPYCLINLITWINFLQPPLLCMFACHKWLTNKLDMLKFQRFLLTIKMNECVCIYVPTCNFFRPFSSATNGNLKSGLFTVRLRKIFFQQRISLSSPVKLRFLTLKWC